ncbi:hypothetical protein AK812_SmicGene43842 [Symbiodinium microadriaticum]|uniref:Uncharacterized protein n=1 Tax=Symbiodinium microadriaticum TaxID=2951 RepID=A0A1Q9BZZ2_SYMMI|nr:hypothetical protein AK812_SmicGene43842 [Symbiodinium microadriaticum]
MISDDVCKKHIIADPDDMAFRSGLSNCLFDAFLSKIGIAQNADKQVHHVLFRGTGSNSFMRTAYSQNLLAGGMHRTIKYLGAISHFAGSNAPEITARIQAARGAWCSYGKLWSSPKVASRPLVTIFKSGVYSHAVSGLEARVLTQSELDRLDRFVFSKGRKVMRGDACAKILSEDGTMEYHAIPSKKVWRFLQLVPTSIELRVRRLKHWQSVARCPHRHVQLLASVFGQFSFEASPTLDAQGRIAVGSNPWAMQFERDIRALQDVDDGINLVHDFAGSCLRVFTDPPEQRAAIDCTALRRQYLSVAIPPPGFQDDVSLPLMLYLRLICVSPAIASLVTAEEHMAELLWRARLQSATCALGVAALLPTKDVPNSTYTDPSSMDDAKVKGALQSMRSNLSVTCHSLLQCITTHVDGPTPAQAVAQNAVPPE